MRKGSVVRVGALCCVIAVLTSGEVAWGQGGVSETFSTLGLTQGQTLRLNVVALDATSVQLGFADVDGQPVGPSTNVDLAPGRATYLDLNGDTLLGANTPTPRQRVEVRPVVTRSPTKGARGGKPGVCLVTAEVFDTATRATSFAAQGSASPGPNLLGLLGLTRGQTLRLSVVASSAKAVHLSFADLDGRPVGPSATVHLLRGQATFLDVSAETLLGDPSLAPPGARRVEVRPVVTVPSARNGDDSETVSVEIFDQASLRTVVWMAGTKPAPR
jgi:hypothetical protein